MGMSEMKPAAVAAETLKKAEQFVEQEEGAANRLRGWIGYGVTALAVGSTLFHLYAAYDIVPTQTLRPVHVGLVLVLIFLLFPVSLRFRDGIRWWDLLAVAGAIFTVSYMLLGGEDFGDRASLPIRNDVIVGALFILLVLEATRRTTGAIMPVLALIFIAYAYWGPWLPAPWTHRGYDPDRLVGHHVHDAGGHLRHRDRRVVDASSSCSPSSAPSCNSRARASSTSTSRSPRWAGSPRTAPGARDVLASFLLGGPSGSGVATTVTLGAVAAYPMLAKVGYSKNAAGGLLAAGGLGAIISPPVLGAAAFLIAEFLKISYLDVIRMAIDPDLPLLPGALHDGRDRRAQVRHEGRGLRAGESAWSRRKKYWFHFLSLFSIVGFMLMGYSPVLSVFWATWWPWSPASCIATARSSPTTCCAAASRSGAASSIPG
jgi:TRAP-type uncharacterized transport system fused permease subunit